MNKFVNGCKFLALTMIIIAVLAGIVGCILPAIKINNEGMDHFHKQEYEQAITDFSQAIKLQSNNALFYYNRGSCYYQMGQNEKALADFNKAIELNPKSDKAYNNRGLVYSDMKQYNRAVTDFNSSIKLNSTEALAFSNRGLANYYLGHIAVQDK